MIARVALLAVVLLAAGGCCGPARGLYPPDPAEKSVDIYVVNNHWHTAFVVAWPQLSPTLQRYLSRFAHGAEFVEIGWGDEGYYRAPKGTAPLALRAMFASRGSVLHVAALAKAPAEHYLDYQVDLYRIRISETGNRKLMTFLERTFARTSQGQSIELQPGLYGISYFFRGRGWYGALHTCNNWVADGVRSTGFPIMPLYAGLADNVGWQIRVFGAKYQADIVMLRQ
ncbi:TIGR02117 family protein [soil metagenome]